MEIRVGFLESPCERNASFGHLEASGIERSACFNSSVLKEKGRRTRCEGALLATASSSAVRSVRAAKFSNQRKRVELPVYYTAPCADMPPRKSQKSILREMKKERCQATQVASSSRKLINVES
jgi:hypothetical protein